MRTNRHVSGIALGAALLTALTVAVPAAAVQSTAQPTTTAAAQDLARWVNPFVGTRPGGQDHGTGGGAGNTFPGAVAPFGMVQWSPDTVKSQPGGYFYDDNRIKGFSLTHLSGAGCDTYEDVPFLPFAGEVSTSPATDPDRYVAGFGHDKESASPGKYSVTLNSGVGVDLAATQRTGAARFRYPAGKAATLLVNPSGSVTGTDDASITIGKNSISGWAASGGFCGTDSHYKVYFHATFDTPFAGFGTWRNGTVTPGKSTATGGANAKVAHQKLSTSAARPGPVHTTDTTVSGPGSGGYVTFDNPTGRAVNVHLGLSFVSLDGAKRNLAKENANRNVDAVAAATRAAWNAKLNQVAATGGTDAQRRTFYTGLYHALVQPNVFSDTDGRYVGFDGRVHTAAAGHAMYTNFSGWDIYRSEAQLLALLAPHQTSDMVRSMMAYAEQGGSWDRWTVANDYTGVMNGDPYHVIVSTAYAFGATDFDAHKALLLMVKGATQPTQPGERYTERPGLADYLKLGYVPGAGADTLEYVTADFAIAQLARRLGDTNTYQIFAKRAQNWQNLFNPATGHLQPRNADGSFSGLYDPASPQGWVEGNGAQYDWMVPHNLAGLITAFGGNKAVQSRLDTFFTKLNAGTQEPYAFLGNEPNANSPWVYAFAGAAHKSQAIVRRAMTELYNPNPQGLVGNDDLGQMSSWYVFSALGIFPEIPGRAEMVLGAPLFPRVVLTTGAGKKITITGVGAGKTYVQGLRVNGQASNRAWLPESFVHTGGTLDYTLADKPNTAWGNAAADAPPSFRDGETSSVSYVDPARTVIPAGKTGTASVGVRDLSGTARTYSYQLGTGDGLSVTPASGSITVPAGHSGTAKLQITVAKNAADGTRRIPVTFRSAGMPEQHAMLTVLVAEPNSWLAAVNNTGISPDAQPDAGDFDGGGWSYSADALAKQGVTPGTKLTVGGIGYRWPSAATGEADNVQAGGQTITVPGAQGATKLGLLGAAADGKSSGTVTITYTDGSTSTASVGFSDWTLGAGADQPSFGNVDAVSVPYRNNSGGTPQQVATHVFGTTAIPLTAGKTVRSVTLPKTVTGGVLHVFAIGVG